MDIVIKVSKSQKKKHLPKRADKSHRSHVRNKACWARGQKRKAARREAQAEREAANRILWAEILSA